MKNKKKKKKTHTHTKKKQTNIGSNRVYVPLNGKISNFEFWMIHIDVLCRIIFISATLTLIIIFLF